MPLVMGGNRVFPFTRMSGEPGKMSAPHTLTLPFNMVCPAFITRTLPFTSPLLSRGEFLVTTASVTAAEDRLLPAKNVNNVKAPHRIRKITGTS